MRKRDREPPEEFDPFSHPPIWDDRAAAGAPLSSFEFLDDEDALDLARFKASPATPLPYAPVTPSTAWEVMDADYRQPPGLPPPQIVRDLFRRPIALDDLARRARLEFPVLCVWVLISCLAPAQWLWFVVGAAMIGFSFYIRVPLQLCGLQGQAGIYRALGAGQVVYSLSPLLAGWTGLSSLLAIYGLVLLLCWCFVECRQLYLIERYGREGRYPALYFY